MRSRISVIAIVALACGPASAQTGACTQQSLRGVWRLTCTGSTDLAKYNPGVPAGTFVPFAMLARMVIDASGKGAGTGVGNLGGSVFSFGMDETFTVSPDCTADKAYTFKLSSGTMAGKAKAIAMPAAGEIRVLIVEAGEVVMCEYKKMSEAVPQQ